MFEDEIDKERKRAETTKGYQGLHIGNPKAFEVHESPPNQSFCVFENDVNGDKDVEDDRKGVNSKFFRKGHAFGVEFLQRGQDRKKHVSDHEVDSQHNS